jgi:hypothetical protein
MSLSCSRVSQHVTEPEVSSPYLQELTTGPYSEPDESSTDHLIIFLKDLF